MDVLERDDLSFPQSLPDFQRLFPDDAACAAYLEKARWGDSFVCPHCQTAGAPFRFTSRPGVLRCRKCRCDTGLTAGTVMERTHTPLSVWFWAAYLVASQTPGVSATQFQRQVGLSRYETAFQILHKLRAGMVRPDQDRIGGGACDHVEVDETWVGGRTRGKGRGVHDKLLVAGAVEVRQRKPGTTSGRAVVTPDVSGSLLRQTAARNLSAVLSKAPLLWAPQSSPTIGPVTPASPSGATNTSPSPSEATPRSSRSICRSFISSSPT